MVAEQDLSQGLAATELTVLGRYVVADPKVCHGRLTFRGTRIFVADILGEVAAGLSWDAIVERWGGRVPHEAIEEAVRLAREALLTHYDKLAHDTSSA